MAHSLYITGTEGSSGKTVVTLGLMHFLQSQVRKVAFFRPIIDSEDEARRDSSINLILKHFELDMLYRDTYACTYKEALELVTSGNMSLLIESSAICWISPEKSGFTCCFRVMKGFISSLPIYMRHMESSTPTASI